MRLSGAVRSWGARVYFLIKLLFLPIWLPFKILIEIAEHSGRRRHYAHRRRTPAPRRVRTVQPRAFTGARATGPASASPRQSMSRNHKVLAILLGSLVLLFFVGLAAGAPSSPRTPGSRAPAASAASGTRTRAAGTASAPASGLAATHYSRHHLRKHRKRRHHSSQNRGHTATSPAAPTPTPAGCYPTAASGNCYEPGEFCPHADAGVTGVAGNGERIVCEDNNGLRWEPV